MRADESAPSDVRWARRERRTIGAVPRGASRPRDVTSRPMGGMLGCQVMPYWWEASPVERYWCEITDRDDIGADLKCPQTDETGDEYWSY